MGRIGGGSPHPVIISYRTTLLGAHSLHPLLTAVTPSPTDGTLAQANFTVQGAQQSLCLSSNLTTPNPAKVCIPRNASQLMVPTLIQILKTKPTFTSPPTPAGSPGCFTLKSTPQPGCPLHSPHHLSLVSITSQQIPTAASHSSPFSYSCSFQSSSTKM